MTAGGGGGDWATVNGQSGGHASAGLFGGTGQSPGRSAAGGASADYASGTCTQGSRDCGETDNDRAGGGGGGWCGGTASYNSGGGGGTSNPSALACATWADDLTFGNLSNSPYSAGGGAGEVARDGLVVIVTLPTEWLPCMDLPLTASASATASPFASATAGATHVPTASARVSASATVSAQASVSALATSSASASASATSTASAAPAAQPGHLSTAAEISVSVVGGLACLALVFVSGVAYAKWRLQGSSEGGSSVSSTKVYFAAGGETEHALDAALLSHPQFTKDFRANAID